MARCRGRRALAPKEAIAIVLIVLAGLSGLAAAKWWWRSGRIDIDPPARAVTGLHYYVDGDYSETVNALKLGARLSRKAALWAAISAALSMLGALAGLI